MSNGSSRNSNKDRSSLFQLSLMWIIPVAFSAQKKSTNKTRSSLLIEPGKILRTDYRKFCFSQSMDFYGAVKYGKKQQDLLDRIKKYLWIRRDLDWDLQNEDKLVWIEFAKLDDAHMFVLSFADVIYTNGVHFE